MATYFVENEDWPINNWGSFWLVEAENAKEAIDKAYKDGNRFLSKKAVLKRKLTAYRIDKLIKDNGGAYNIL